MNASTMRALTIQPGHAWSAELQEVARPVRAAHALLVRTLAIGICGTDRELVAGLYGAAPPGQAHLILGHESLGIVEAAAPDSPFKAGDRVVGIVRRPDDVPCPACAVGEWDMCQNGRYTERGISQQDGYCSEWFCIDSRYAVKVDPALDLAAVLLEPASVVAKAWQQIEYLGRRSRAWNPSRVLITGAGTVGLLALLLSRQRGFETHVYDRVTAGAKPRLAEDAGATYHSGDLAELAPLEADIIIECTGAAPVVTGVMRHNARNAIVCLAGLSAGAHEMPFDVAALNQSMVLQNDLVFGTVNANRAHYELAAQALARADRSWLQRLISRRVALDEWRSALQPAAYDIKVIIDFSLGTARAH